MCDTNNMAHLKPIARANNSSMVKPSDAFVKSIFHDIKPIKPNNNPNGKIRDEQRALNSSLERALTKTNDFNATGNKQSNFNYTKSLSLWDSPQSPAASIKTLYHSSSSHSNSKESLWASAQSSPNSVQREQIKQQLFSPSASLWENPTSKLSQASLMSKNDSTNSIWSTPPRMQSPPAANQNGWDNSVSLLNQKTDGLTLIRPQDLSPSDHWHSSNATTQSNAITTKFDAIESKWANTMPTTFNRVNPNLFTSTPIKPATNNLVHERKSNGFNCNENIDYYQPMPTSTAASASATMTPASSSCLQLFSDEFINYLNMIN